MWRKLKGMSRLIITNSYQKLGKDFYQQINPTQVENPELVLWNDTLARRFSLSDNIIHNAAAYFSGNRLFNGSIPIAQAYAGHQFGGFSPQLGDGRAHLLGELTDLTGTVCDIQLKGSGQTRFSRRGDGRCALKPAIREFIMSEAMHHLGISTTQCLSVVTTGETLYRGNAAPGAVVSRIASSHIRVGTFQYFAAKGDHASVEKLLNYAIEKHYPEIDLDKGMTTNERIIRFLEKVINRQVSTVVDWMRVGFIHGVMNTDNMTISGETIDYGPCAMMGVYDPQTVYSSIDEQGRYCYSNQPAIVQWNLARLAETLLPLMGDDTDKAVQLLEPVIVNIMSQYEHAYYNMMRAKLGLVAKDESDVALIDDLLNRMQINKLDYTQTFVHLMSVVRGAVESDIEQPLGNWFQQWKGRVSNGYHSQAIDLMTQNCPIVIPRNHHVEQVLDDCQDKQAYHSAESFLTVLRSPYKLLTDTAKYQDAPLDGDVRYRTFCGT